MSYVSLSGTERTTSLRAERRIMTFVTVLGMHIGLIALLFLSSPAVQQQKKQGSFSVFSLASAAAAPDVPITVPILPSDAEPVLSSPPQIFAEQQQGAKGDPDGELCSPVDAVTTQLINDPLVPAAINRVPREDRSISEAIVMWNAEWSSSAASEGAPLAEVRERILLTLKALPPDCLAMPVVGPRLIPIADGGSTTFMAFGSGEWSWQQLTEPPKIQSADGNSWTWEDLIEGDIPPIF